MHTNKVYTGIGSRETPEKVQHIMANIAEVLAKNGWVLRSGGAEGADQAFEAGARFTAATTNEHPSTLMEIYVPWKGFGNTPRWGDVPREFIVCEDRWTQASMDIAARFHPGWLRLSEPVKKLHARNSRQMLGRDLSEPTNFVVCWTAKGKRQGGTGQALRLAEHLDIPIFDLAVHTTEDLEQYINHGVLPE